jgi:hypothetical protein
MDPGRPVNALLKSQVEHLYHAARRLPLRYRSEIYVNAIKTEGEAGEYIRQVTEAIRDAHEDAAVRRARPVVKKKKGVIEIAAVADERAERKAAAKGKKKSSGTRGRKTK